MDKKLFLKNSSYTVFANLFSMLVSAFMVAVLPKFMTVTDYGIWQLYLFYISYVGLFSFGMTDGIYLRYAGKYFDELPKVKFTRQLLIYFCFEVCVAICIFVIVSQFVVLDYEWDILITFCITMIFLNAGGIPNYALQITGKIGAYAILIISERFVYLFLVGCVLFLGIDGYRPLLKVNMFCGIFAFLFGGYLTRHLFTDHSETFSSTVHESWENVRVGSQLLLANVAGMLVIGVIRFAISKGWSVEMFGKISLALSLSLFALSFVNSVSIAFFPMLKRIDEKEAEVLYNKISWGLGLLLPVLLLAYYPIKFIMGVWIPKYSEAFMYMGVLFPIFLFESRLSLLVNTYLKAFRQENAIMKINFVVLAISIIYSFVGIMFVKRLDFMVFGIFLLFVLRCCLSEYVVSKVMPLLDFRPSRLMIGISVLFVLANQFLPSDIYSFIICAGMVVVLLLFNKARLKDVIRRIL